MLNDFQYFASAFEFYVSLKIPDLHSLLSRMKDDLRYLTVGKVSLQFDNVDTVVRLVTGGKFEDPDPVLEQHEFEVLRRPIFLSRYLDKLASQEMEIHFRDTRALMTAIGRRLMTLPEHLRTEEELECIRAAGRLDDVLHWLSCREKPQGRDVCFGDVPPRCLLDTIAESLLDGVPGSSNGELIGFVQDFIDVMREFTLRQYRITDLLREPASSEPASSASSGSAAGSAGPLAARVGVAAGLSAAAGVGSAPATATASALVSTTARREAAESADTRRAQGRSRSLRYVFRIPRVENVSEADKEELSEYILCALKQLKISVA
ncbi:unnamed protein product [Symbiodinium sp. CCMP2592]|nr:unnamed protein product [Symbiodinium sp. CCMP2592]